MAQLSSPGVSVSVIDESFYTPAAPGTVPLIVVASAEAKQNGAGTGTAPGTLKANAGKVWLLTSQKDLSDTFGTPIFKTDVNNNPIHAGEQNEYGLQAAYSYLGVSNRAYVVRADIDLGQLDAKSKIPAGAPADGTFWLDTSSSKFGIFEWNSSPATVTGGQTFTVKTPIVITDAAQVESDYTPKSSIGKIGSYAIVALTTLVKVWFKKPPTATVSGWVEVGSPEWVASWPTAQGTISNPTLLTGDTFVLNSQSITNVTSISQLANYINTSGPDNVINYSQTFTTNAVTTVGSPVLHFLSVPTSRATVPPVGAYVTGTNIPANAKVLSSNGTTITLDKNIVTQVASGVVITVSDADDNTPLIPGVSAAVINDKFTLYSEGVDVSISGTSVAKVGMSTKTYSAPMLTVAPHTQVPQYKISVNNNPTGSIWIKTTSYNLGADWIVKRYNSATKAWVEVSAPIYTDGATALMKLDSTGGGINLPLNALYVKSNAVEMDPVEASFKLYRRRSTGATTITTAPITSSTFGNGTSYQFSVSESIVGSATFSNAVTITFVGTNSASGNIEALMSAINSALTDSNIVATKNSATNQVIISHLNGGEIKLTNITATPLNLIFSTATTANYYADPAGDATVFYGSLWSPLTDDKTGGFATASANALTSTTADGQIWYNSIIDEVDIMVHDGIKWSGYRNVVSGSDLNGPQVRATAPKFQSDGTTSLVDGDLWISTADLENFPLIHKWDDTNKKWVLLDNSDQTTENGVLFHDARWDIDGTHTDPSSIQDLLTSNFVDFDAPDPALYPQGMLLWNLRRSGFNVKHYVHNYIDVTARNKRYNNEVMTSYYTHRWVSLAANNEDGSGAFGRDAQRKVVIQSLQELVNSNQAIRDEESRVFNLMAAPGYPELIGELKSLNYDRGLTAFIVGDTPARLTPDATSLSDWGNNMKGALEDNDNGLVTADPYLGVFYPWGYTSDNIGNNIAVPPSHMMLRTIALSDQVSYPWFAPAGTRRGGITNASAVGYISAEGEFVSVALNNGQRDTLASIHVNPITFISGSGLINYGQMTRQLAASSLDRINVARLVIYLRRQLSQLSKPYIFEPNDKITRDEIKQAAESLLLELVGQRALYDFVVVCDTSNNTPARIDRSELYLDIAIEPVKAVEFIYIPLRLKNTGEIKGLGA